MRPNRGIVYDDDVDDRKTNGRIYYYYLFQKAY